MTDIDWSKAPEGATHWEPYTPLCAASWMMLKDGQWFFWSVHGAWAYSARVSADRVAGMIKRPSGPWSGQGLPPVGTVCEVMYCEEWTECEIIAHFKQCAGMVAAFTVDRGDGIKLLDSYREEEFRPIRTPEQIAAEEREKAIQYMREEIGWTPNQIGGCPVAALYDAGYRKQEPKP